MTTDIKSNCMSCIMEPEKNIRTTGAKQNLCAGVFFLN